MAVYHFRQGDGYFTYLLQHKKNFKKEELEAIIAEAEESVYPRTAENIEGYLLEHKGFEHFEYYALIDMDDGEIYMNEEKKEGDET